MECVDAFVGVGRSFFCLFYEQLGPGDHLSRVYWFAGDSAQTVRLVCEVKEWLVSIWANGQGMLWGAAWDGRVFRLGATVTLVAETDLLGTIKLAGFGEEPDFLMGEDGLIFERKKEKWLQIKFRGSFDVYSVARRKHGEYWFVCSDGRLLRYEDGIVQIDRLETNMDLHGIAFSDPDSCLIAGDEGVLLLNRMDDWRDLTDEKISLPDVHAFQGKFVLTVEGERIEMVTRDGIRSESSVKPGYYLSSNDQICVTFYEEAAMIFDGAKWIEVPFGTLSDSLAR